MRTIEWKNDVKNGTITLIDQTLLPGEYRIIECKTVSSLCEAIVSLRIRGAPALGAAGGYGNRACSTHEHPHNHNNHNIV